MNFVQPIRDPHMIEVMKIELQKRSLRDYLLFVVGINTGLRISDILKLKVCNVANVSHIIIKETKTGKQKRFLINSNLQHEFKKYIQGMDSRDFLFVSRHHYGKAISRVQAYRILNSVASDIGLLEVGTHTLRKTFGYHFYQKTKDIALLQKLFNHSSPSITLKYIGITQDMMDDAMEEFAL